MKGRILMNVCRLTVFATGTILVLLCYQSGVINCGQAAGSGAGEVASPPEKERVFVLFVHDDDVEFYNTLRKYLMACYSDESIDKEGEAKTDVAGQEGRLIPDLYIRKDVKGRITVETEMTLYTYSRQEVIDPSGRAGTVVQFLPIRIPDTSLALKDIGGKCRGVMSGELAGIKIDGLLKDLAEWQIFDVPRIVEYKSEGREYLLIIPRTLITGRLVDPKENKGEAADGATDENAGLIRIPDLVRQRDDIIKNKTEIVWEDYKLILARPASMEVNVPLSVLERKQGGEGASAQDSESGRVRIRAYLKTSILNNDASKAFVKRCQQFWDTIEEAVSKAKENAKM